MARASGDPIKGPDRPCTPRARAPVRTLAHLAAPPRAAPWSAGLRRPDRDHQPRVDVAFADLLIGGSAAHGLARLLFDLDPVAARRYLDCEPAGVVRGHLVARPVRVVDGRHRAANDGRAVAGC